MKRTSILVTSIFIQVMTFAQRGRGFRPEWDMERSHSYHNIEVTGGLSLVTLKD